MDKITGEQQQEIAKLEQWFGQQLNELKQRQLEILREYEAKKIALLKKGISNPSQTS